MESSKIITGCHFPVNMEKADDIIKSLCLRENDIMGRNYLKYRSVIREVYLDLNLHSIRQTQRYILPVDKNTLTVELPDNTLKISNIAALDNCGNLLYMDYTDKLIKGIVDLSVSDNCGCECGCSGNVCKNIKSYEPLLEEMEEEMPDASFKTFTAVTRKRLDPDGTLWVERTFPIRKYEAGEWVDTVLTTETERLCNVDVQPCGCVKETEDNAQKVLDCCSAKSIQEDCGCCAPIPDLKYGVTEEGDRLVMPPNFIYDKVVVRVFPTPEKIKDLRVPMIAKPAFIYGIKNATELFDLGNNTGGKSSQYTVEKFEQRFRRAKDKLFDDMHKWSLKGLYEVLTPKIDML